MSTISDDAKFAQTNLMSKPYRERIEKLEAELSALSDELLSAKINILQDNGYKPLEIDEHFILVPVGWTLDQLYTAFQQVPPDIDDAHMLTYLVEEEDRKKISESQQYSDIVQRREDIISQIRGIYTDFWDEVVSGQSDTETEAIAYMVGGLEREIKVGVLNDITGAPKQKCKKVQDEAVSALELARDR